MHGMLPTINPKPSHTLPSYRQGELLVRVSGGSKVSVYGSNASIETYPPRIDYTFEVLSTSASPRRSSHYLQTHPYDSHSGRFLCNLLGLRRPSHYLFRKMRSCYRYGKPVQTLALTGRDPIKDLSQRLCHSLVIAPLETTSQGSDQPVSSLCSTACQPLSATSKTLPLGDSCPSTSGSPAAHSYSCLTTGFVSLKCCS